MPVTSLIMGGAKSPAGEPASIKFVGQVSGAASVRLAVSRDPGMMNAYYTAAAAPTAQGMVYHEPAVMAPNMERYYAALELDGVLDTAKAATFRTFPEEGRRMDYDVGIISCSDDASNSTMFEILLERDLLAIFNLGDWGYPDRATGTLAQYRTDFELNLTAARQQAMLLRLPVDYIWDDHDWLGNDSFKDATYGPIQNQVYRERFPYYDLPGSGAMGIYHSFMIGRDLHVFTDLRSFRDFEDDPDLEAKTMMGAEQEGWFEGLLIAAAADTSVDTVIWYSSSPWIGEGAIVDHWAKYPHNRDRVAGMAETFQKSGKLFMQNEADLHALRYAVAADNPHGAFPVIGTGALDASTNSRGGPYSTEFSEGLGRWFELRHRHFPGGKRITAQGRIWNSDWKRLDMYSPAGFLPAAA